MERPTTASLLIGAWRVNPATCQIEREGEVTRLEVRTMRLLMCLAERAGQVVSIDELLTRVWPDVTVSSDSVYQAIASLRRQLGDDPRQPSYIATVPRLGYQMVATVSSVPNSSPLSPSPPQQTVSQATSPPRIKLRTGFIGTAAVVLCIALVAGFLIYGKPAGKNLSAPSAVTTQPEQSVAVLPFLDLTPGMKEGEFADGMTEELIDKLAKVPGLRVPSPTSSFYFKGKQLPVAEIAHNLGVVYVLDGSVRKDGSWIRVATRLIRADNGYVIWTDTYDRPFKDILMIQDDIANAVTRALKSSIKPTPSQNQPR
jgi:transcriptional activator of cad operon